VILVVGAHSRNVGKTSVACAIMRSTPQLQWTAIKISSNRSGLVDAPCWSREAFVSGQNDTGRYLSAGARSAWWLRATNGQLPAALPRLLSLIQSAPNVLIESNRIVDLLQPDCYLLTLDLSVEDFKDSAHRLAPRADGLVFVDRGGGEPSWAKTLLPKLESQPRFRVTPPDYASREIITEIRQRATPLSSGPVGPSIATAVLDYA
jgi:hypothetical protein